MVNYEEVRDKITKDELEKLDSAAKNVDWNTIENN